MASKRPPTSSSPSPRKKAKISTASQQKLEFFFSQQTELGQGSSTKLGNVLQDVEYAPATITNTAFSNATSDVSIHSKSKSVLKSVQENGNKKNGLGKPSTSRADVEIIDVDEFEEISSAASVSKQTIRSPSKEEKSPRKPMIRDGTFGNTVSAFATDVLNYPTLSVDPLLYPFSSLIWSQNKPAPYSFITHTLCSLAETRSRISIMNILTNSLRSLILHDPASITAALYLLSNSLSPPYLAVELGLGPSIISKAIQHVSGLTSAALRKLYTKTGDAGDVAFEAKSNVRTLIPHAPLSILGVYKSLLKIAGCKGEGATKQKQAIVENLLVAANGEEVRYLVRTLVQHIRVGAVRTSILSALARAMVITRPAGVGHSKNSKFYVSIPFPAVDTYAVKDKIPDEQKVDSTKTDLNYKFAQAESLMKRVFVQHPNFEDIVSALLDVGLEGLAECVALTIGIPLHPMLGTPARSLDEIYERLGDRPFTAELKYDGQRAQIHACRTQDDLETVKIFSRHLEDMTDKFPDIVSLVKTIFAVLPKVHSFILDAEIVAIDPINGTLKTFQELSGRARKDVCLQDVKVIVCVFVFDIMFLNGKSLLEESFRTRRSLLRDQLPPLTPIVKNAARMDHVQCFESDDGRSALERFWQDTIQGRSEGLMIKLLDNELISEECDMPKINTRRKPLPATYEPDKRTSAWLKLKKDYVENVGDSLDLVPIGAWHGNGRKAQWWSPILLAVWNQSSEIFVGVCKCMSGFTDEFYKALNERYKEDSPTCSRSSLWNCDTGGLKPTVYFKPQEVWEIRGADITVSPVSAAAFGLVSPTRGLSLRFPRFIRIRNDKDVMDASTPEFLADLWRSQDARGIKGDAMDDGDLIDAAWELSEVEDAEFE